MKLNRQFAWLLTGPLAALSGCSLGPFHETALSERVIPLSVNAPLTALQRSTRLGSDEADEGTISAAGLFRKSTDPEDQRQVLLTGARRRMSQQMTQQMMMTMPMLSPNMAGQTGPMHPGSAGKTPSLGGPALSGPKVNPSAQPMMLQPQMMTPEMMEAMALPQRRGFRGFRNREETRSDAKATREETAATTEADRIERAANAEAERAEKAALAEATIAERRLLAEAELAERMTRAELELAERLASAKEERDRRIAMTREERELRMAILGIDTSSLKSDPVDDALARIDGTKPKSSDSGSSRFAKFLRPRTTDKPAEAVASAPRKSSVERDDETPLPQATAAKAEPKDLVERSLADSNSRMENPAIAEFASSKAQEFPSIVQKDSPSSRQQAAADPVDAPTRDFDSLLAQERLDESSPSAPEDWSLLDGFLQDRQSSAPETTPSPALEFPVFAANEANAPPRDVDPVATSPSSLEWPAVTPTETTVADNSGDQKRPEDDLWILGPSGMQTTTSDSTSGRDTAAFDADRPFPVDSVPVIADPETYSQQGGLFARSDETPAKEVGNPSASQLDVVTAAPVLPVETVTSDGNGPPEFPTAALGASTVAAVEAPTSPHFDWSHSAPESVDQVVHQPQPSPVSSIHNATWVHQSLRDVCGPLPLDLESLVMQLDIPEAGVRKDVLEDLGRLGAKARPAAPAIRVLLDDSPLVAAHAAWTLWQIEANESQTVNELVRLLQTGESETVQFTAYALGSMGPKALQAAPVLRAERERFNGATRVHVAEALTRIDAFDQASVEVLMYGLKHPETHVRWLSALALGDVQPRYAGQVMPALIDSLKDADPEVRSAAALTIGGFGPAAESAIPELRSRASLDAPSVQEAAQTALACIQK